MGKWKKYVKRVVSFLSSYRDILVWSFYQNLKVRFEMGIYSLGQDMSGLYDLPIIHIAKCEKNSHVAKRIGLFQPQWLKP